MLPQLQALLVTMGTQQTDNQKEPGTVGNTLGLQGKWPGSCYRDGGAERLLTALRLFTSGVNWSLLAVRAAAGQ